MRGKDTASHARKSQPTISSFFSQILSPTKATGQSRKRSTSPIDLTLETDELPQSKRRKSTNENSREPLFLRSPSSPTQEAVTSKVAQPSAGNAEKWRFLPSSQSPEVTEVTVQQNSESAKLRREAFKMRLLGENSVLFRRRPSFSIADGPNMEVDAGQDSRSDKAAEEISGGEDEVQDNFEALREMFSAKSTNGKGNGTATATKGKRKAVEKPKKAAEIGPSGQTYTPLELQVRELKTANPDTLLMVEVGYKYRFFGEDAKAASRELGIVAWTDRNFVVASIPTHRRDIHLKKLLSQGHKVGIVGQTETAALKSASENRSGPFERRLTHLYTAATYVDELNSVDDLEPSFPPPLMCLIEDLRGGMGVDERVCVGMVVICPSTGDVLWDEFEDTHMRTELETRILHTNPSELLLPSSKLSKPTEKMLKHFTQGRSSKDAVRIDRFKSELSFTDAFSFVSKFYTDNAKHRIPSENVTSGQQIVAISDFPQRVVVALAHSIQYLSSFNLADTLLKAEFFAKFTSRAHMLLNGNTLTNLEIYQNETDRTTKGSLMWILDRTSTKFGSRLLKSWVGRPLVDMRLLQERVNAVEEILMGQSAKLVVFRGLLKNLPDLAKGLCRIQYGKCTPQELAVLFLSFNRIATTFDSVKTPSDVGFKSSLLNNILFVLPKLREPMRKLLGAFDLKKAEEGSKIKLWTNPDRYPAVEAAHFSVLVVESEIQDQLKLIRKEIKKPSLTWTSVAGEEYLVEVKKNENREIPPTWFLVSSTKSARRYHTPEVKRKIRERAQHLETLQAEANKAYLTFLEEITANNYGTMREVVNQLAVGDCLFSLAALASQGDYSKPQFIDDDVLEIVDGRHPMVEALRPDPFVPNSVRLGAEQSMIITGPNMGGKSSSVRMVALIAIMAQIGSYVPAASVKMGMLDGILTRMGASDELAKGRSTFMVEMSETSDILATATSKTLVILDELGRGSSTFDGMAIASAVMQHLVEAVKCKTLFITHYPLVATDMERQYPSNVKNVHMSFTEDTRIDGTRDITFLYRLTTGLARGSFGIECGCLAGIPEVILRRARTRADKMQSYMEEREHSNMILKSARLMVKCFSSDGIGDGATLRDLRDTFESISVYSASRQAT